MRSSVIANLVLATVPALIASGGLGCNSCSGCREKDKSAAADGADESGEGDEGDPSAGGGREMPAGGDPTKPRRTDFIPITAEEIKPFIPPLTGAAFLKEATPVAGGRRINVTQCVSGNELEKVKVEYEQFLANQGFKLTPSGRPRKNWHVIRADKDNLRVSATLRNAEYPDCKESEKKTKVFLTYYKRLPPRAKPAQPPGAAPGQPGAAPGQPPGAAAGQPGTPTRPPPAATGVDAGPG